MESDVPMLESLTLHDNNGADYSNNMLLEWKTSGLVKSPNLRKIDYTPIRDNFTDFSLTWAQLTDIKLSHASYAWGPPNTYGTLLNLVLVLSLSPRLINFHSEIGLRTNTDLTLPSSLSSSSLPNLQKLIFHDGGINCSPLFELLNVPALLHLEFFPTDSSSFTVLSTFLPHVASTVLSLTTSYAFFGNPNHYSALSQCQKLTSIIIKSALSLGPIPWSPAQAHFVKDIFLDDLTLPTDRPNRLAPALEVFECQMGGNFSDAAVLRFIKAKHSRPDIANLRRISIVFTRPKELDILSDEEAVQYVAEGLRVDLHYAMGLNPKVPFSFRPDAGVPRLGSQF